MAEVNPYLPSSNNGDTAVMDAPSQNPYASPASNGQNPYLSSPTPASASLQAPTYTAPDSVTAPIPKGISRDDLKNLQLKTRVESVPAALADKALSVAEPIAKNFSSDLLNTPNNLVGLVAPVSTLAKPAFQPQTPAFNVPQPKGTGFAAGLGRLGAGLLSGLTTPESIVTLPAASQSAIVRALFGGQMASDLPESARNAINVLQDPNATTADKVVAVGNPIVQSAMIAGLAAVKGGAKPSGIKDIEQPETPNEEIAPPNPAPLDTPATAPEAPSATEPSISPAAPAEPLKVQPALKIGDKIFKGGDTHGEILGNLSGDEMADYLSAPSTDAQHIFLDQTGNELSRADLQKQIGVSNSEDIPAANKIAQTKALTPDEISAQTGANYDGEIKNSAGESVKGFTFKSPTNPLKGVTFNFKGDVTPELVDAKIKELNERFSGDKDHTIEEGDNGKFNIVNPSGNTLETFDSRAEAEKVLPEYNTPGIPSEVDKIATQKEIPLGINRPDIENPNLRDLSDADFDAEFKDAKKTVNVAEKGYDDAFDKGEELTPQQRQSLADAQDRWGAADLERTRRNYSDTHTEDIFHKMVDLSDVGNESGYARFKILVRILQERGGSKPEDVTAIYKMLPERVKSNPDFKEALGGKLVKFKEWLQRYQNESRPKIEAPKNPSIAPKISEPEANVSNAEQTAASQPMAQNPTGLKFDTLDKERAERGLEPLPRRVPVSDQETMAKAQERLGKNEDYADNLVKELNLKPRSIDDVDRAALLIRKIDLEKQYSDAADDLIKSNELGDQDAAASANVRISDISDKQKALEEASGKSGSEQGAGLRFLRVMANEDYSLSGLERKLRASKGGAPLTDAERAELVKTANDYKAKNEALENHVKELQEKNSAHEVKAALDKIAIEAKTKTGTANNPKPRAGGILSALESRANAARERIKNRPVQLNAGLDPTQLIASLRDEIEIGAYHVARIGVDVVHWTKEKLEDWQNSLKKELGDKITPNLPLILEQAKKTVDDASKPPSHEEQVAAQSAKIKEKFDSGKKDEIATQVQKLARLFVERGITGRDALIDAVHNVLKESDPEITRRETMDAISGYGDFKQLSKDEISVKLRGLKGEMQQVSKLEDMADGIPPSKTGVERRTPTDAERKLIKAVNEAKIKFQVPITDPVRQIKSALDTRKIQIENSIKDLQDKIKNEDFSKRVRRPLVPDRKLQELQAQKERVVKEFKGKQLKYERDQLSKAPRAADFISNLRRFSVLSGVHVLGKLAAYSATKIPTIAATELAGKVISKIPKLSEISNNAPSEGGGSLSKLARATAKGLTQGIIDAYKTGRYGQSDLKAAFSKRPETERNWLSFFQTLHEVIKSPLRRASFELSLSKRMLHAAKNGADINDPLVQLALSKDAYLDSDRDLLLENNRVANDIRVFIKNREAKNKFTGEIPPIGKGVATGLRVALPILTVPLNYVKQTLDYGFGLAIGSGKAAMAFKRGIKNLDPQEADAILRHLKRGSVGGAAILYGFYDGYKNANNPNNATFGGFYQPGEKRKDNQAGINGIKIGNVNLPGIVLHNPVIAAAQLGSTFGKILASKISKKSNETHSAPIAAIASLAGLLNQSPIGSNAELLSQISDVRSAEYAAGEYAKSLVVPQIVQEAAQHYDKDANGNLIKRSPSTAGEHIKTGIPGLRQTVPAKKADQNKSSQPFGKLKL